MKRTLNLLATLLIAAGTVFMLAMSFGVMSHRLALFLGTACFVVGGLLWGQAAQAPRTEPGARPPYEPAVSPRDRR